MIHTKIRKKVLILRNFHLAMMRNLQLLAWLVFSGFILMPGQADAQIHWPQGQLLPSFPATAKTQDLIYLNGSIAPYAKSWTWQAEGSDLSHGTGKAEGDGWVCIVGEHEKNKHMVYGPYNKELTSGLHVAEFRLKIDNISGSNVAVADIDVRNASTGVTLATKTLNRQDFSSANAYLTFNLDFKMPADNQELELRVLWKGNTYLKVDYIRVRQDNKAAENYLFSSMKGVVNRTQPRIFSYEGDALAEGPYAWLTPLGYNYIEHKNNTWAVLTKYKDEIDGLIVYDPLQNHTVNLALRLAHEKNAIIAAPSLLERLTSAPYNFPILEDLRGRFTSSLQVYQTIYDDYWDKTDQRVLIGLSPDFHQSSLREYALAIGAAVIWLDPKKSAESTLLNKFLASMPQGSNYLGWWPEEQPGVDRVSNYGITTIPSDYSVNLTYHSGMPRYIDARPMPVKPELENKIYVAFIISDGDNLQYIEHSMRKLWEDRNRGAVPIGWTISPAMVDAMPGALNFYHQTSTENDNLISGPSGYGYTYPNNWISKSLNKELADFVTKLEEYNQVAGIRVVTIWNTITGGINGTVGNTFAANSRTLLGVTAQNTGGALSIYGSSRDPNTNQLPGKPLSCNYCTGEQAIKDHIISGSKNWDGKSPRFLIIQANPWNNEVNPTGFLRVMNYFNQGEYAGKYSFVRPDHIFQLIREDNDMEVNPGGLTGDGEGLTATYYNGENFEEKIGERIDDTIDFDWGAGSPMAGVDNDHFTIRWQGEIQPTFNGHYTFYATCDGVKLWIDDQLIIDNLDGARNPATYTGKIDSLAAGEKYRIKMEYREKVGDARCRLEWASAFLPKEVVPKAQLYRDLSSGTNDVPVFPGLKVYASNGILAVAYGHIGDEVLELTVHDLCGTMIMRENLNESHHQFDVSSFAKGVYLIGIRSNTNNKTIKCIFE